MEEQKEDDATKKAVSIFDRAEAINKKLEENIKKQGELMKSQQEIADRIMLGGGSQAGQAIKTETAEEKWAREARIRYAGTGMDPTPRI